MWILLSLAAALFQVLRNTTMKRLGHALDEYINVWGRFTFLLPFAGIACVMSGFPELKPDFYLWCLIFGVCQTLSTLALSPDAVDRPDDVPDTTIQTWERADASQVTVMMSGGWGGMSGFSGTRRVLAGGPVGRGG